MPRKRKEASVVNLVSDSEEEDDDGLPVKPGRLSSTKSSASRPRLKLRRMGDITSSSSSSATSANDTSSDSDSDDFVVDDLDEEYQSPAEVDEFHGPMKRSSVRKIKTKRYEPETDESSEFEVDDEDVESEEDPEAVEALAAQSYRNGPSPATPTPHYFDTMQPETYYFGIFIKCLALQCVDDNFMRDLYRLAFKNEKGKAKMSGKLSNYYNSIKRIEEPLETMLKTFGESSKWVERFGTYLRLYPELELLPSESRFCGVCVSGRSKNRRAAGRIRLHGTSYDRITLKLVKQDVDLDNNEEEEEDEMCYDVGSECLQRVLLCHKLHNFKFTLFKKVRVELGNNPTLDSVKKLLRKQSQLKEWYKEYYDLIGEARGFKTNFYGN